MSEIKELENLLEQWYIIKQQIYNEEYQKKEKLYSFLDFFYTLEGTFLIISLLCFFTALMYYHHSICILGYLLGGTSYIFGKYKKKKLELFLENKSKILDQNIQNYFMKNENMIIENLVKIDKKYNQKSLKNFFMFKKKSSPISIIMFLKEIIKKIKDIEENIKNEKEIEEQINQAKSIYEEKEMSINQNLKYNL